MTTACAKTPSTRPTTAGLLSPPIEARYAGGPRAFRDAELWTLCFEDRPEAGFCLSIEQAREIIRRRLVRESLAKDAATNLVEGSKKATVRAATLDSEARLLRILLIVVPIVAAGVAVGAGVGIGQALTR
jgi:hypothetical protein